jgi:osmotically-inducible protein OsmY
MGTVPDASYKFLAEEIAKSVAGVKSVDNRLEAVGGTPEKGTDPWIAAMVKAELMSHPTLNVVESDVYVRDGRVTLRGEAVNPAQRDLAGVYARDVEGVRDVVNDIRVTGPAGAAPQASAEPADDAAITTQVGTALEANRSTTDIDAVIVTSDGIVTVSGFADSQAQKDLVTKIIADIDGVKGVNNQLMVQEPAALVR